MTKLVNCSSGVCLSQRHRLGSSAYVQCLQRAASPCAFPNLCSHVKHMPKNCWTLKTNGSVTDRFQFS